METDNQLVFQVNMMVNSRSLIDVVNPYLQASIYLSA